MVVACLPHVSDARGQSIVLNWKVARLLACSHHCPLPPHDCFFTLEVLLRWRLASEGEGEEEDRDQEDREQRGASGDLLEAPRWAFQEGGRALRPLRRTDRRRRLLPGGRPYVFGDPSVEGIMDRFLGVQMPPASNSLPSAAGEEFRRDEAMSSGEGRDEENAAVWEEQIERFGLEELARLSDAILDAKRSVSWRGMQRSHPGWRRSSL
ncbi:unnamed protein product [Spirodela intermedia]|uniref:Uncharacterized protein n=1 Tax=Spirodela intermedia TaxID=51605 RepID=A0A7I8J9T4_SPIIN|nr:unnamed protein product [Spirodela intermedia]CAA6666988.1 unnamed protein product [Spirodela intermedia]